MLSRRDWTFTLQMSRPSRLHSYSPSTPSPPVSPLPHLGTPAASGGVGGFQIILSLLNCYDVIFIKVHLIQQRAEVWVIVQHYIHSFVWKKKEHY